MISSEKRSVKSISVWPGYVDALSALLMVVILDINMVITMVQDYQNLVRIGIHNG